MSELGCIGSQLVSVIVGNADCASQTGHATSRPLFVPLVQFRHPTRDNAPAMRPTLHVPLQACEDVLGESVEVQTLQRV